MGAGGWSVSRHDNQLFISWDYIFIENNEIVRTWLLSNPVLDDIREMIVYCYHDSCDNTQNTPLLTRVNYLVHGDIRHRAHDPEAPIGNMHIGLVCNLAYSEICDSSDGYAACNDPMIGKYNNYHLSPNGILSGNQRWYRLLYMVYQ